MFVFGGMLVKATWVHNLQPRIDDLQTFALPRHIMENTIPTRTAGCGPIEGSAGLELAALVSQIESHDEPQHSTHVGDDVSAAQAPGYDSPELPIEIWEQVFDALALDTRELHYKAVVKMWLSCMLVCRTWAASRCRLYRAFDAITLGKKKQVAKLAKIIRQKEFVGGVVRTVVLHRARLLGLFATMVAQKLPKVQKLEVHGAWPAESLHADATNVFLPLAAFTSITYLTLGHMEFPSALVFGRLACSLPNLSHLECTKVHFASRHYVPNQLHIRRKSISHLAVYGDGGDVMTFFAESTLATNLRHVILSWPSFGDLQRMLECSGASLSSLDVSFGFYVQSDAEVLETALSLRNNTSLESLSLNLFLNNADTLEYGWLYAVLSTISTKTLSRVSILLTNWTMGAVADGLDVALHSPVLDPVLCSRVDQLMCGSQFSNLATFTILCKVPSSLGNGVDEETRRCWQERVSLRFPRLAERAMLCVQIESL
ncbi:uncharacterized protein FIBRA_08493 [Fibroporia radiculosa]|uniref:F-box domain-containing protein n=1 Tax=Fibroporia radiculosa TaxID=599839 RepID=J4H574_9APHY|nr:uncharacterized protein FIBRA_08493 [Fibroporia radiculosa]CCM06244.1 predicted protein [Fibroporia radiculosa]